MVAVVLALQDSRPEAVSGLLVQAGDTLTSGYLSAEVLGALGTSNSTSGLL